MSLSHAESPDISRRGLLVLAASALGGCGGGGSGGVAGLPGTGGTGIYAQGSISGFGSVIENSVKFDDTLAQVQIDGATATSVDLRLGMVFRMIFHSTAAKPTMSMMVLISAETGEQMVPTLC